MGQSKSRHLYAFQPLPWPEALAAFRLIDQICGIASSYATTHLEKHATVVLDKVHELQRLPHLWDAFEADFERLRGTYMVRLATDLHNALEKLEGSKYDMGMLAQKDLTFKSRRQAAEKALVILREVEEAHRAFHYAFELALYGSMRREEEAANGLHGQEETTGDDLQASPIRAAGRAAGGGGGGAAASSGGGSAIAALRRALKEAPAADLAPSPLSSPSRFASPPPPPPAPEDSWMQSLPTSPQRTTSPGRSTAATVRQTPPSVNVGEISPESPAALVQSTSLSPRRPQTADATTMARNGRPTTSPGPLELQQSVPRGARSVTRQHSSRSHSGTRRQYRDRDRETANQQYVVMYMPQGPDGGGPRAILIPANALQPAPSSPAAVTAPSTVTGGVSPFATNTGAAYAALPAAQPQVTAAVWGAGSQYLTSPSSPAVPPPQLRQQQKQLFQQQQQPMTYTYTPSSPSPPVPSPPIAPFRSPGTVYRQPYSSTLATPSLHLTHTYSAGSGGSSYSPYISPTHTQPASYRYFTPPPGTASPAAASLPSAHSTAAGLQGLSSSPSHDRYGASYGADQRRGTQSSTLSFTASGTPNLNAFLDRPALSGGGSSGGWLSPLAVPGAAVPPAPAAAPGAAPGSMMMLQPVSAHTTPSGGLMLHPQYNPMQPPLLVMATQFPGSGGSGNAVDSARDPRSGRGVRFSNRDGGGGGGGPSDDDGKVNRASDEDDYDDEVVEELARESSGTNGSHHTYTYGPRRRNHHAVPPYLVPYGSGEDDVYKVSDIIEPYGMGRRMGRRYSDGGTGSDSRPRDRSGGNANELVNHYRGRSLWDDEAVPAEASRRRRSPSLSRPPPLRGGGLHLSRDAEVQDAPLALASMAARGRRSRRQSNSGRTTPPLTYERLATLAGLDPEVLGGGAAAGLASQRNVNNLAVAATATPARPTAHRPSQFAPAEPSLRRAELLSEAAESGDWAAAVELAGLVRAGWWGDARDAAVARGLLLQAALRGGSAEAHAALGHMAERGEGLPGGRPDLVVAARHYGAAAAGGHRDATTALAYLLEHGLGIQQDEPRAAQLYAAAAQRNCPTAANNLAKMILDGRGATAAATAAAAAAVTASGKGGEAAAGEVGGAGAGDVAPPATIAKALLKRAARAGSASAWYNLGVCHLQQVKQSRAAGGAGGAVVGGGAPLAAAMRDDVEVEALHCFAEASKRGHARAALRAGYLYLQRSAAAAAVEAYCAAALNVSASRSSQLDAGGDRPATASGPGGAAAVAAGTAIEAEALWCLAQLAERQAAVLEVRKAAGTLPLLPAAATVAGGGLTGRQGDGASGNQGGGDGTGEGSDGEGGSRHSTDGGNDTDGDGDGIGGAESAGTPRPGGDGDGDGDGDASSTRTGGTENRAVGQLLATLASSSKIQGPDGAAAVAGMAAAATAAGTRGAADGLEDPAAATAVRFAKEICRLDFSCCRRPAGHLPFTTPPRAAANSSDTPSKAAPSAPSVPFRGLRRLRQQAREVLAEEAAASDTASAAVAVIISATPGSLSEASSAAAEGGSAGAGAAAPMAVALARLELELQQPAERARGARRAAAELMAAAAVLGHAAAQHWLAGWRWSMGQQAAAVALWAAAGRRGHGPALMVLGQMAESGQLPVAAVGMAGGGGGNADLASAARYYLQAQEAGAPGAVEAMRRVQKLLQRHVALQGKLEAVAAVTGGAGGRASGDSPALRRP
ncbi:hypothetical protein Vafri_19035 [Volvox africanus]|uniref:Uncharacterized protein n=1 Tax=Volvox africanus TaxID=51714 RepID=A0A8J4BNL4_9CHLO|nr:hypothetical protein Vafri_19035 [Volvox africanus]